jgi:hypothetical protein
MTDGQSVLVSGPHNQSFVFCRTHDHILLSSETPGPHIYIPQEQGGSVIPLGIGFSFVASYDSSQGCGGVITRLHTGPIECLSMATI